MGPIEDLENETGVFFHYEGIDFILENEELYHEWIEKIFSKNNAHYKVINYIFCDDEYLLDVNRQYLNHDYYTDIISFPYAEHPQPVEGDIFISIERVKENSEENQTPFENELKRVMAHGILHFLGYKDKSEEEQHIMRAKEEEMITLPLSEGY